MCLALLGMTLLHRPYLAEGWMLAQKHWQLARAARALAAGDPAGAHAAAERALAHDPESALARVAQARAALLRGDEASALGFAEAAIAALPAQPCAHLLRGAILRAQGDQAGAQVEFGYERASREDLQAWSWEAFRPLAQPPHAIEVGRADLGWVRGFWLPEPDGTRWTQAKAELLLAAPGSGAAWLVLELDARRPAAAPRPQMAVLLNGRELARLQPANGWASYRVEVPAELLGAERRALVELRSETFRPRDYDRASPDDRELGVRVRSIAAAAP